MNRYYRAPQGRPYPDDEDHWVELSADAVCGLAACGDDHFARLSGHYALNEGRPPAPEGKGRGSKP